MLECQKGQSNEQESGTFIVTALLPADYSSQVGVTIAAAQRGLR